MTAGPWVFVEWYPNEYRITNDGERDRIALIDSNLPDGECRANARLIAAAPELLQALQACIADGFLAGEVLDQASAAIARATGSAS